MNQRINGVSYGLNVSLWDQEHACVLFDVPDMEQVYRIICQQMDFCRQPPPYIPGGYPQNPSMPYAPPRESDKNQWE